MPLKESFLKSHLQVYLEDKSEWHYTCMSAFKRPKNLKIRLQKEVLRG